MPRHGRAAGLLSFSSFFVFPALPLGRSTAMAIPYALAVLLSIAWFGRFRRSEWIPFALMMAPLILSAAIVVIGGYALAPDVVPKLLIVLALSFVIVMPMRYLFRAGYRDAIIVGAAWAIVVHAAIGVVQAVAFERSEFPFQEILATNPGMGMPSSWVETYAVYVRRPFGLFAEPSAMAACLGPWLLVVSMALFSGSPIRRTKRLRALLLLSLVAGLSLVVLSRSGQAAPIMAGAAIPAILAASRSGARGAARWATLLAGIGIVGGGALWLSTSAAERISFAENNSWQLRLESLRFALAFLLREGNVLVGVGPGQSVPQIGAAAVGAASSGVTAVWSVTLTYAMETGFVGVASMLGITTLMVRAIWRSSRRIEGMTCAGVWFFGVLLGTSYAQQPALWTAMAALMSWREVAGDLPAAWEGERRNPVAGEGTLMSRKRGLSGTGECSRLGAGGTPIS